LPSLDPERPRQIYTSVSERGRAARRRRSKGKRSPGRSVVVALFAILLLVGLLLVILEVTGDGLL